MTTHDFILYPLLFLLLVLTVFIVRSPNIIRTVIYLNLYSLLMALVYLLLAAPDVAMTEAAIGACFSSILLLSALPAAGNIVIKHKVDWKALIVCVATAGVIIYAVLGLPEFGSAQTVTNQYVSPFYIHSTSAHMGINNIVTAILAGYRSLDTLGETFVVFTALVAVLALFSVQRTTRGTSGK
jgi:multicomponent Na+:H+ antiporter subunit B